MAEELDAPRNWEFPGHSRATAVPGTELLCVGLSLLLHRAVCFVIVVNLGPVQHYPLLVEWV